MKTLSIKLIFLVLFILLPGFAFAGVINPPGGNAWDLWVFGNGEAIFNILKSVKLLLNPTAGDSGYQTLLLIVAVFSFIVLAISAGFDPAKNFLKMFTFVFVVWFVSYGTTKLTVNVQVNDALSENQPEVLYEVPALVAFPGVFAGLVGKYFTEAIETNFSVVDGEAFLLGGQGVGQFNLFGKMLQESSQYIITVPELKKSVSQYTIDCVIPAIHLNRFAGPVMGANGVPEEGRGLSALLKSTNMMETLGSAQNKSIFTKYYPADPTDAKFQAAVQGSGGDAATFQNSGALLTCETSYGLIKSEMEAHAEKLLQGGNEAWAKAGVIPLYDTAFKTMLVSSSMLGTTGSPSSYIMQMAMVNSMNGAFRQAAIQTGNNSLMQAAAISQADASQWSSWSAGFSTFNNTMGYVYIVLQAFIFAITPLIMVALLIPGMGKAIFVNYAQILAWLTLWMPSLAIINYLIMLFAISSVGGVAASSGGGPTMANKALISESVNHLMVAAQFLGTMIPLITWGIVKGAMAFTEFISNGIGSQFASQAGSSAATGNLSMNNLSMDNTSLNKFSTMASSQVGFQAVQAGTNAGAVNMLASLGGQGTDMNLSSVSNKNSVQDSLSKSVAESQAITSALQAMSGTTLTEAQLESMRANSSLSSAQQTAISTVLSKMQSFGEATSAGDSVSAGANASNQASATTTTSGTTGDQVGADAGLGLNLAGIVKAGGSVSTSSQRADQASAADATSSGEVFAQNTSADSKQSTSSSSGLTQGVAKTGNSSSGGGFEQTAGKDKGLSYQDAVSQSLSDQTSITSQLSSSLAASKNMDFASGVAAGDAQSFQQQFSSLRSTMGAEAAAMVEKQAALSAATAGAAAKHDGAVAGFKGSNDANFEALKSKAGGYGGAPGAVAGEENFKQLLKSTGAQISGTKGTVTEAGGTLTTSAADNKGKQAEQANSRGVGAAKARVDVMAGDFNPMGDRQ